MNKGIVIIPTYNEIENIELIIKAVMDLDPMFHILVVDDNSPDGTAQKVRELQQLYGERLFLEVRESKRGLGTAYILGFKWALQREYEYIFEMDADFSHNPADLLRLYQSSVNIGGVAIGSRYINGVNVVNWPLNRVLMSYFASIYVRIITGMKINDATAGFMCFPRKALEQIGIDEISFLGYAFQIEMKYRAFVKKIPIEEVSIIFTDRVRGKSKMSINIFSEAFFGVINLRIKKLLGKI